MSWFNKMASSRPAIKDMTAVTEKEMNPILFRLLSKGNSHPHEEPIRQIIIGALKAWGHDTDANVFIDEKGNLWFDNRTNKTTQRTMFSSHMDTVHDGQNEISLYQTQDGFIYGAIKKPYYDFFEYDNPTKKIDLEKILKAEKIWNYRIDFSGTSKRQDGKIKVQIFEKKYNSDEVKDTGLKYYAKHTQNTVTPSVLGADDKLGCYIMLRMIHSNVPGLYVFHVGEERGCIGSRFILDKHKDRLEGIQATVAFDRAGYEDVIAHQRPGRCASKEYTNELAIKLNEHMPKFVVYKGDVQGVMTDTAIYYEVIPECVNISVGYFDQHSPAERFDLIHLEAHLVPACCEIKWDELTVVRDPTVKPAYHTNYGQGYHRTYNSHGTGVAKVAPKDVVSTTPFWKCPEWKPENGLIPGVNREGMMRIVEAYYDTDCRTAFKQSQEMYKMIVALNDVSEQYLNLRLYCADKNILDITDELGIDTADDPNGDDLKEPAKVPDDFKNFVGAMNDGAEVSCTKCHREWNRCVCRPERSDYETDAEFEYDTALYEGSHKKAILAPNRKEFKDQATFDAAMGNYNAVMQEYIDDVLGTSKKTEAELVLADPEVQARLEK